MSVLGLVIGIAVVGILAMAYSLGRIAGETGEKVRFASAWASHAAQANDLNRIGIELRAYKELLKQSAAHLERYRAFLLQLGQKTEPPPPIPEPPKGVFH